MTIDNRITSDEYYLYSLLYNNIINIIDINHNYQYHGAVACTTVVYYILV